MSTRAIINLEGIVQGVGFRPFIHRLRERFGLFGFVANTSNGVEIEVEGERKKILYFYQTLKNKTPPLARITDSHIRYLKPKGYKDFVIKESKRTSAHTALISPDVSICNDCLKELLNPSDRRYLYPFINCTNCGPRFSIIKDLPYDRQFTTMKKFKMCRDCEAEYKDINDRRYHAQPNACSLCGPDVELIRINSFRPWDRKRIKGFQAIEEVISLLKKGGIVAIKGIGGFHIACDAENISVIKRLRKKKKRPFKPFAIMLKDMSQIKKICYVSKLEQDILNSPERPIVLLKKKRRNRITEALAPNNNYLGIMLPYTPLHYLLFLKGIKSLVMTSGNIQDEPIEIENLKVINNLRDICDYFLIHNRDIYNRCDDSIVQVIDNKPIVLRRARGYSPLPFPLDRKMRSILGCGAELKNTFCLTKNRFAFLSQYIGDLKTYSTFNFYKETILRFKHLFAIKPEVIAFDLHPDYLSTSYAQRIKGVKLIGIQHHKAHIASVIAEHRIKEKVIGVSFDGIGLGLDGKIWGGEFFCGDLKDLKRVAHLEYVPMPGGDMATKEPYRMAISYLYMTFGEDLYRLRIDFIKRHHSKIYNIVKVMNDSPFTSSAGRLFDATSSLLGICDIITYEAQAAIELQMKAESSKTNRQYEFELKEKQVIIIDSRRVIKQIVEDLEKRVAIEEIARKFHNGLTKIIQRVCSLLRKEKNINTIALSGGVFQNKLLLESLVNSLRRSKFKVYFNELLPTNDGAISLGQVVIANTRCA
ncbi:MAG: carbamoyltransferase HypF [Candidatus Omnitrophica bacterium]|nr:carbamoyltransferase HypF [Candidatus Omnitrophota bacterium]